MKKTYGKFLKGKFKAELILTREAIWGCTDHDILPDVAADIIPNAADYVLAKNEGDRFTIASPNLKTVVTGIVLYKDTDELELLVTNIYGDAYIIKGDHCIVD